MGNRLTVELYNGETEHYGNVSSDTQVLEGTLAVVHGNNATFYATGYWAKADYTESDES